MVDCILTDRLHHKGWKSPGKILDWIDLLEEYVQDVTLEFPVVFEGGSDVCLPTAATISLHLRLANAMQTHRKPDGL